MGRAGCYSGVRRSAGVAGEITAWALSILGTFEKLQQRSRDESEFLAQGVDAAPAANEINDGSTPLLDVRSAFAPGEMLELRARLLLSNNTFGGLYGPDKYESTVTSYGTKSLDVSGHNWELLRQQAEAEGLYFEPLTMPDGTASANACVKSVGFGATIVNREVSGVTAACAALRRSGSR